MKKSAIATMLNRITYAGYIKKKTFFINNVLILVAKNLYF
jgi:hypothetical protein